MTGKERYKFGSIDDCSLCPFFYENEKVYKPTFLCSGSPDSFLPCTSMGDYGDMTLEEVVEAVDLEYLKREDYYMTQERKRLIKVKKNKDKSQKSQKTRNLNYSINKQIRELRGVIKRREDAISSLISLKSAFSFADSLMYGSKEKTDTDIEKENPQITTWRENNERDQRLLEELIKERDKRNRERRRNLK